MENRARLWRRRRRLDRAGSGPAGIRRKRFHPGSPALLVPARALDVPFDRAQEPAMKTRSSLLPRNIGIGFAVAAALAGCEWDDFTGERIKPNPSCNAEFDPVCAADMTIGPDLALPCATWANCPDPLRPICKSGDCVACS